MQLIILITENMDRLSIIFINYLLGCVLIFITIEINNKSVLYYKSIKCLIVKYIFIINF